MQLCCHGAIITFLLISHKPLHWSWNWIYRQKAYESSFPMICLLNGNIVKFSYTNWKHFTIGDPMAFPIVKMENKNSQNLPFPLHDVNPHVIQQCLGPPHAPHQTAAPTVEALSHTDAVKSPLVTMVRTKSAAKSTPSHKLIAKPHYLPHPWGLDPSDLWCQMASRSDPPFFHNALDRPTYVHTDQQTDRSPRGSLMTIGRYASNKSDAA